MVQPPDLHCEPAPSPALLSCLIPDELLFIQWAALKKFILPLALVVALPWLASCSFRVSPELKPVSAALAESPDRGFAGEIKRMAAARPGLSGFAMIPGNREAFTDRVALADAARETLDVQYYIWSPDTIGNLLADHVIRAAERGVRVRFLIDDLNVKTPDGAMAAIAAHPNIEVRLFNPERFRTLRKVDLVINFRRLNHRMHNKVMIMDNACAVIGGRNIANEYFGLHERHNMRDLDIVAAGPVVKEVSAVFDEFWNSEAAVPVQALAGKRRRTVEDFQKAVAKLRDSIQPGSYPYPLDLDVADLLTHRAAFGKRFIWAKGEVLYDSYDSILTRHEGVTVAHRLGQEFAKASRSLEIEAAYFVIRKPGRELGRQLLDRGVKVRVLTNSLASTNQPTAQSGHAKHRREVLETGVELYELRPDSAAVFADVSPRGRQAKTGLHTKAFVIDDRKAFVGSYNFDPRSADINSEIGLLVDSPAFARQVSAFLDAGVRPDSAYRVTLEEGRRVKWETVIEGRSVTWNKPPETTFFERFKVGIYSRLPIESQL